jgi:hypothetical protein
MSVQSVNLHVIRRSKGASSLGLPCAAMAEVQIGDIPKLTSLEVASTP